MTLFARRPCARLRIFVQVLAQLHLKTTLAEAAGRLFALCVQQNYVQVCVIRVLRQAQTAVLVMHPYFC